MSDSILLIEQKMIASGPIEVWTVNRPQVLNALNSELLQAIEDAGVKLEARLKKDGLMACRALIVTGAGEKAFVAGADIAQMKAFTGAQGEAFGRLAQSAFTRLEILPIPTIAAVNGFALGGGMELAMGCDVILASPKAEFGQPEAYLGLIPGFGGTARFADRLGVNKALELLYSGKRIKADEALRLGLIQRITEQPLMEAAMAFAEELTVKSGPLSIAYIKKVVRGRNQAIINAVQDAEAKAFGKVFETADGKEGIAAFLEKRKAAFQGH